MVQSRRFFLLWILILKASHVLELFDVLTIMAMHQSRVGTFVRIRKLLIALPRYFIVITFRQRSVFTGDKIWGFTQTHNFTLQQGQLFLTKI